jgi:hypothetical protein
MAEGSVAAYSQTIAAMIGGARVRATLIHDPNALRAPALVGLAALTIAIILGLAPLPRPLPPLDPLSLAHLDAMPTRLDPVTTHPYCALAWNLPAIPRTGPLASCNGVIGAAAAAAVVTRYGGHVLAAQLAKLRLYAAKGITVVDGRTTWILSVDRFLPDIPVWIDPHHDCSPGRVLVLIDASRGKPLGELAWGKMAPTSPGDPCPT